MRLGIPTVNGGEDVNQSGDEFDTVKAELDRIAKFTGSLAGGSLTGERQRFLDRRKELLSSLSEEDKYILGIV